ncbi:MAG: hypothetical protein WCH84_04720, partial [Verrucomicrobiota bacterium]
MRNLGTINATSGTLVFTGSLVNAGQANLGSGGTIQIGTAGSAGFLVNSGTTLFQGGTLIANTITNTGVFGTVSGYDGLILSNATTPTAQFINNGVIALASGQTLTFAGVTLTNSTLGYLTAGSGATLVLSNASFVNLSQNAGWNFGSLADTNITLLFNNTAITSGSYFLTANSISNGPYAALANQVIPVLNIAGGYLTLTNANASQNRDVLYVDNLTVANGATLNLNGNTIYFAGDTNLLGNVDYSNGGQIIKMLGTAGGVTWAINGGSNDWNLAGNWSPNVVPTAYDAVTLTNATQATVTYLTNRVAAAMMLAISNNNAAAQTLLLSNSTLSVSLTTLVGNNGIVQIGDGSGSATFSNTVLALWNGGQIVLTNGNAGGLNQLVVTGTFSNGPSTFITMTGVNGATNQIVLGQGAFTNAGSLVSLGGVNLLQVAAAVNASTNNLQGGGLGYQDLNGNPIALLNTGVILLNGGNLAAAAVTNVSGGLIAGTSGSSSVSAPLVNQVGGVVSNAGATWTLNTLSNLGTFVVINGGGVTNTGAVSLNTTSGSTSTAQVTGAGSTWAVNGLEIGSPGGAGAAALLVTNGGQLTSLGAAVIGNGSSNNTVNVAGSGVWDASASGAGITVGSGQATGNVLTVNSGGTVLANGLTISASASDRSNVVTVAGGNLFVTNAAGNAKLIVGAAGAGTLTLNSGTLFVNQLLVTNNVLGAQTNSIFNFTGGTLITSNAANAVAANIIVPYVDSAAYSLNGNWTMLGGSNLVQSSSTNSSADRIGAVIFGNGVGGVTATVNNAVFNTGSLTPLQVGNGTGGGNVMIITNGGKVWAGVGPQGTVLYSGLGISSSTNTILVTGAGSFLGTTNSTGVGYTFNIGAGTGVSNSLIIANGGVVTNYAGFLGGNYSLVLVTSTGSIWNAGVGGASGNFGQVIVSNGATLVSRVFTLSGGTNSVLVTGPGSVWTDTSGFMVGKGGFGDSVIVSNGGVATTAGFEIGGGGSANGSNNFVIVTSGGVISNTGVLTIGYNALSSSNGLIVANGGTNFNGTVNIGTSANANNNYFNIGSAGAASYASNGAITVGGSGGGFNTMTVTNATVLSTSLTIGNGSSNNTVSLQGADNSIWNLRGGAVTVGTGLASNNVLNIGGTFTNVGLVTVGSAGASANSLTITNGGTFLGNRVIVGTGGSTGNVFKVSGGTAVATSIVVSATANDWNNSVNVAGGSLFVTNAAGTALLNVGSVGVGTLNINSGLLYVNQLLLTNNVDQGRTNSFFSFNGGTLTTSNAANKVAFNYATPSNSTVNINSSWNMLGGSNLFTSLTAGGNAGTINLGNGAGGAIVTVTTGVVWNVGSFTLVVGTGATGAGNELIITNGGQVLGNNTIFLGATAGSSNNAILVTGAGSLLTNAAMSFGANGNSNTVTVNQGGALLMSGQLTVGAGGTGKYTLITVSDTGSVFQANNFFYNSGGFNTFIVSNGAAVSVGAVSGSNAGGSNTFIVTGPGSVFTDTSFTIGGNGQPSGGSNNLTVSKGGLFVSGSTTIGSSAPGNWALVTDAGSVWSNTVSGIAIGGDGSYVVVSNQGAIFNAGGVTIGGYSNVHATVTGSGSVWSNGGAFSVSAYNGSVSVVDSGQMLIGSASIGASLGGGGLAGGRWYGSNSVVEVAGTGSVLTASGSLVIGAGGNLNKLLVTNGAQVSSFGVSVGNVNGAIGTNFGYYLPAGGAQQQSTTMATELSGNSNMVVVSGPGSSLNLTGNTLTIGRAGLYNMLVISNGGVVVDQTAVLGNTSSYNTNFWDYTGYNAPTANVYAVTVNLTNTYASALVSGAGSAWTNTGNLTVGNTGAGNTLTISNSAFVTASNLVIGAADSSTGNVVKIVGGSLYVTNNTAAGGQLIVGQNGGGVLTLNSGTLVVNQLLVTNNVWGAQTNSIFNFTGGTLITSNAANAVAANIEIVSNTTMTVSGKWIMQGGSNLVSGTANSGGFFSLG